MLKNDTLKNGTSRIGLYGSTPPGISVEQRTLKDSSQFGLVKSFVLSCFHFYLVKRKALTRRSEFHHTHMVD